MSIDSNSIEASHLVLSGTISGTGQSEITSSVRLTPGRYTLRLSPFVGTTVLERSDDNGSTWHVPSFPNGQANSFSGAFMLHIEELEPGTRYRWNTSAYTSGGSWRLARG